MVKERSDLKNEAVKIDGFYIEDMIPSYTTLKSTGREYLPIEYESFTVGSSDGEKIKRTRYPARIIKVEFLIADGDLSSMRMKLNHLANILSTDEADFVFNDESDKFFTGFPIMTEEIEKGKGWVSGTWQILCTDPFKYSTAVYTAEPSEIGNHDAQFIINYGGTYPSRPVLSAEFAGALSGGDYSQDGDCGYVAFIDDDENIIQLGNPDAIDLDEFSQSEALVNHLFSDVTEWEQRGGKSYGDKEATGSVIPGNISDTYWKEGEGQTLAFAMPVYGTETSWHGPILWKSTEGAVDFDLSFVHRMCVSAANQIGTFECGAYNLIGSKYTMIAGIVIEKTASGSNGKVKYIVNDTVVESQIIDLSYYNTNFGYCRKDAVYKTQYYNKRTKKWLNKEAKKKKDRGKTRKVVSGYTYTQSNLNTSINKSNSTITFKVGNLASKVFTNTDIELVPTHNISFHFGQKAATEVLHTNAVASVRFSRNPSGYFADIPNVFMAGDVVKADCNDATVYIRNANTEEGHYAPQFGALGNDWEDFRLQRGVNNIQAVWSEWVNTGYKPDLKIYYNEVFI